MLAVSEVQWKPPPFVVEALGSMLSDDKLDSGPHHLPSGACTDFHMCDAAKKLLPYHWCDERLQNRMQAALLELVFLKAYRRGRDAACALTGDSTHPVVRDSSRPDVRQ